MHTCNYHARGKLASRPAPKTPLGRAQNEITNAFTCEDKMEHDTCDLLYLPLVTTLEHVVKISQQFFIQNRCVEMG